MRHRGTATQRHRSQGHASRGLMRLRQPGSRFGSPSHRVRRAISMPVAVLPCLAPVLTWALLSSFAPLIALTLLRPPAPSTPPLRVGPGATTTPPLRVYVFVWPPVLGCCCGPDHSTPPLLAPSTPPGLCAAVLSAVFVWAAAVGWAVGPRCCAVLGWAVCCAAVGCCAALHSFIADTYDSYTY